jgi:hypothetical protein
MTTSEINYIVLALHLRWYLMRFSANAALSQGVM